MQGGGRIDPSCTTQSLNQLAQRENNALAKNIVSEYSRALSEGNFNRVSACRTQKHEDTNKILGHCVLAMNHSALKEQSREKGIQEYQYCLQGSLIALSYEGNMSAQFILSQIFKRRNMPDSAEIWERSLDFKKDTEEGQLLRKCY